MKKILLTGLLIILILGTSFHFGMMYFNYVRALQTGIAPGHQLIQSK